MRRSTSSVVTVAVLALAGCASVELQDPGSDLVGDPTLVVVHDGSDSVLSAAAFGGEIPKFRERKVADRHAPEPTLGVAPSGVAFYASADAEDASQPVTRIFRSRDDGATWSDVSPDLLGRPMPPTNMDPYLHVDPMTGRVFTIDLTVACNYLSYSDDDGETWSTNPVACGFPVNDHQTLFTGPPSTKKTSGYPNVVYVCTNQFTYTIFCATSLDGGATFQPGRPAALMPEGDSRLPHLKRCGVTAHGHGATSPVDGTVYLPHVHCRQPRLEISRDNGDSWKTVVVDDTVGTSPDFQDPDHHDGSVAVDAAGNVYYVWLAGDNLPRMVVSRDRGETWTSPLKIAAPGITMARFPQITAGDEGRIAVLYVGSDLPGGFNASEADHASATWNAYVTYALDADAERPTFASVQANAPGDPLRRGDCRGRCGEGIDAMYDFLDVDIHPKTGAVWVALVDVCDPRCASSPAATTSEARATVAVQATGATLRDP